MPGEILIPDRDWLAQLGGQTRRDRTDQESRRNMDMARPLTRQGSPVVMVIGPPILIGGGYGSVAAGSGGSGGTGLYIYPGIVLQRNMAARTVLEKWTTYGDQCWVEECNEVPLEQGFVYHGPVVGEFAGRGLVEVQAAGTLTAAGGGSTLVRIIGILADPPVPEGPYDPDTTTPVMVGNRRVWKGRVQDFTVDGHGWQDRGYPDGPFSDLLVQQWHDADMIIDADPEACSCLDVNFSTLGGYPCSVHYPSVRDLKCITGKDEPTYGT